jgi:hypothetical protein
MALPMPSSAPVVGAQVGVEADYGGGRAGQGGQHGEGAVGDQHTGQHADQGQLADAGIAGQRGPVTTGLDRVRCAHGTSSDQSGSGHDGCRSAATPLVAIMLSCRGAQLVTVVGHRTCRAALLVGAGDRLRLQPQLLPPHRHGLGDTARRVTHVRSRIRPLRTGHRRSLLDVADAVDHGAAPPATDVVDVGYAHAPWCPARGSGRDPVRWTQKMARRLRTQPLCRSPMTPSLAPGTAPAAACRGVGAG